MSKSNIVNVEYDSNTVWQSSNQFFLKKNGNNNNIKKSKDSLGLEGVAVATTLATRTVNMVNTVNMAKR